jgi:hypothetical protein
MFGKKCSSYREPNFISTHIIISRLMVKLKLSTSVWKHIGGVLHQNWKNQWAQWLPLDEWWYNTSYHTITYMTPFEAIYGKNPPSVLSYLPAVLKVQAVYQMLTFQEAILCTLKANLIMAQN